MKIKIISIKQGKAPIGRVLYVQVVMVEASEKEARKAIESIIQEQKDKPWIAGIEVKVFPDVPAVKYNGWVMKARWRRQEDKTVFDVANEPDVRRALYAQYRKK